MNESGEERTDELEIWRGLTQDSETRDTDISPKRVAVVSDCLNVLGQIWPADVNLDDNDFNDGLNTETDDDIWSNAKDTTTVLDPLVEPVKAKRFGRFLIERQLGRGGHGFVFRAIDPVLHRPVALKIPNPDSLASSNLRRRFVEESRTLAQLEHPNLLPILEAGTVGPVCYLVTPLCTGPSLAEWLRRQERPIASELAARLVRDLARTVGYVHSRGVLHRDIKPSNILLEPEYSPDGKTRRSFDFIPKLADFGLAKLQSAAATRTATGAVIGTPAYMAPEQAEGRHAEVGVATDVYALGAMLYELLTGRPPYRGESILETLRLVSDGRFTPPRRLRADVPRDLSAICVKCLECEPAQRYRSADDLADDLTAYFECRPVQARVCGPISRLAKWSRRRPMTAILATSLVAVALVGLTATGWQWQRAEAQRRQTEETFSIAHGAIKRLHDALFEENAYDTPEYYSLQKVVLDATMPYYHQLLELKSSDPQLRVDIADVFMRLGHIADAQNSSAESLVWFVKAAGIWQRLVEEEPTNREYRYFLAKLQGRIGGLLQRQNDPTAGERLKQAVAIQEQLIRESPSFRRTRWELSETLTSLVNHHLDRQEIDQATRVADRAIEVITEIPLSERDARPMIQRILAEANLISARAQLHADKVDESTRYGHEAVDISRWLVAQAQDMPSSANTLAQSLEFLARLSAQSGENEQATAQYREAINVAQNLVLSYPEIPKYRKKLASLHEQLAIHYRGQERFEAALESQLQATSLLEQLADDYPADSEFQVLRVRSNYRTAAALESIDRPDDAIVAIERAKNLVLQLTPEARSRLSDQKYQMAKLLGFAVRIRASAGDRGGGIESKWQRELQSASR